MTSAEARLWETLRARRFENLKFRRQAPVAGFIVDFYCAELKLAIELDGGVHDLRIAEDALRDQRLKMAGFEVIRIRNEAFLSNPSWLFDAIRERARGG